MLASLVMDLMIETFCLKRKMKKMRRAMATTLLIATVCIYGCQRDRRPTVYVYPSGFTGAARVRYSVAGKPSLEIVRGAYILTVPRSGVLETSTAFEEGLGDTQYYYDVAYTGTRIFDGGEGVRVGEPPHVPTIWDLGLTVIPGASTELGFFVGTKQQKEEYDKLHANKP